MKILQIIPTNPNERFLDMAVEALYNGEIIIYPPTRFTPWGAMH